MAPTVHRRITRCSNPSCTLSCQIRRRLLKGSRGPSRLKNPTSFPLRLSPSQMAAVKELAEQDGISVNHFIQLALAEKLMRLDVDRRGQE